MSDKSTKNTIYSELIIIAKGALSNHAWSKFTKRTLIKDSFISLLTSTAIVNLANKTPLTIEIGDKIH